MKILVNGMNLLPPAKKGDAGYDLVCAEDVTLHNTNNKPTYVATECAMKLPEGYWGLILPRSSTGKKGIMVIPSVIDEGYTGPLFSYVYAFQDTVFIKKGDRIAQIVLMPLITPAIKRTTKPLPRTDRGSSGFGSTDKQNASSKSKTKKN